MELNISLGASNGDPLSDPTRYRHLLRSLVSLSPLPLRSTIGTF
jgi:hypothetical protein